MRAGKFVTNFKAKNGLDVVLRFPKWEDLDDLLEFINSLVDERAEILAITKATREQEAEWLSKRLVELEKDHRLQIVAEVDGRVVANSDLRFKKGYSSHVGEVAIAIRKEYRDIGIGTKILKSLISHAENYNLQMLFLSVFSTNDRALHVYNKVGFAETGRIPKMFLKDGKFIDEVFTLLSHQTASWF